MAESYTITLNFTSNESTYTGATGTGASVLQVSSSADVGASQQVRQVIRGGRRKVDVGASGTLFFPTIADLPANARITMIAQVEYGAGDVTAVNRLLTWTRDTVVTETNEDIISFSFDTSLTLARTGTEACYITPIYIVRA